MPLTAESSLLEHRLQNLRLLSLSLLAFPASTLLLLTALILRLFTRNDHDRHRRHVRSTNTPYQETRTILVTGIGMTKGLTLARLFYAAGHHVIGADFEIGALPTACGRVSKSVKVFYKLYKPDGSMDGSARYGESLLKVIKREHVDLWVSCSGVASAVEDGRAKEMIEAITDCKAIQYDVAMTSILHEKHTFIDYTRSMGLSVPETHNITSAPSALKILNHTSKRFIMKYTGTDDAVRANMTLLPLSTPEATEAHISRLPISPSRPWILQQFIDGPEFCTHALVVRNKVMAFVACPSAELLMHYVALPSDSVLSRAALRFTQTFVRHCPDNFTGHLSFDFLVDRAQAEAARRGTIDVDNLVLHPIECNPRAHTAVVLFSDTPEMISRGYMAALDPVPATDDDDEDDGSQTSTGTPLRHPHHPDPVYPTNPQRYYWLQHDLVTLVVLPFLGLFRAEGPSFTDVLEGWSTFAEHVVCWRDGTFEVWDPWPAWWLWCVSWPVVWLRALLLGQKWSRVNVSTMKVFGC